MYVQVTKILLGAYCIFSNGTVMSRTGCAAVAQAGFLHQIPVMVLCETIKFSERVQLDAYVFNELANPDDLLSTPANNCSFSCQAPLKNSPIFSNRRLSLLDETTVHALPNLNLLNLLYDVMPAGFVSVVVCEWGLIPVTSIPVVLREYNSASTLLL